MFELHISIIMDKIFTYNSSCLTLLRMFQVEKHLKIYLLLFMSMGGFCLHVIYGYHMCGLPEGARRVSQILWNWS